MDHKVSKDMISSGMIPSGEKTQADLGRTQYGSAPSPSKLMDAYKSIYKEENINEMLGDGGTKPAAGKMYRVKSGAEGGSRQVKSTYGKPQEGSFLTRQKEKLAAQTGKKPTKPPYTAGQTPTETRTRADKDRSTYAYKPEKAGLEGDFKIAKKPETTIKQTSDADKEARRARVKEMQSKGQVRQTSYEKVDLLAAYRSVYEHHKKDADGNTIPHEDEELNEFLVTGTMAALKGLGTMAAKLGVKAGAKLGGKAGASMMKSVARNPMKAVDNINRVGYAAQTVGNLMPKPGVPAVTKKQSQGGMISADADLFDIVKGQLLDEGYSEKEVNEIMVNLTEEQLEEFMKALATRAAQYGANLGREGSATGFLNQRADKKKVLPVKDQPVKSATDVVKAVSAADKPKPTPRKKPSPEQKTIRKEITDKMKKPTPLTPGKGFISANPIRRKQGQVEQENADLFDIVKGQLLDEGLSEEEIKDIMLTLTPDEILNELSVGKMANYISAADKDVQKTADSMRKDSSVMGDDPRIKRMTNRAKGMAMAGDKIAKNPIK